MDNNLAYYIFVLIVIIVGLVLAKRVATCLLKSVVLFITLIALLAIYWLFIKQ